jgi:L-asparaginase
MSSVRAARCALLVLTCTTLLVSPAPASSGVVQASRDQPGPASASRPRVRLIATGGTISNRPGRRLTAEELIASIPDAARFARPEAEQFANVSSTELTFEQWIALGRRIEALFREDTGLAGVVVTSGTDTLEELAYFLHLTVRSDRPVVMTGSMRPPGTEGYDGAANLLAAFRVAAHPESGGQGVLIVLNDDILSAREALKTDAQRLQAFQARPYGVLGVVDPDRVVFYRSVVRRHTTRSEFDLAAIESLPRVDVLLTYQGAAGDLIRASVDAGARGLVIATAAGATTAAQADALRYATQRGIVIVRATRTGAGRVRTADPAATPRTNGNHAIQDKEPSIGAEDLPPVKARVLLMLALTRTAEAKEIERLFGEY